MLKSVLFTSILLSSFLLNAKNDSYRSTLTNLFDQSKGKFKIQDCDDFNIVPAEIFNSIKYSTKFNKKCDIEGEVSLKLFMPFPVNMQIRNLDSYKTVLGTAKLNLGMNNPPTILAELTKAELRGKDSIFFNAYYSGEVMPASTLKVKPGTEVVRVEIFDKSFKKKLEEFSIKLK